MPYSDLAGDRCWTAVTGTPGATPVLLLHGGYLTLESFEPLGATLAVDHEVHAIERPGHGRSPDVDGEYTYERGVDQTVAYLDAAGIEAAHVVGYSDGAIIGLLLARDHPHRVRSLVAISGNLDVSAYDLDPDVIEAAMEGAGSPGDDEPDPHRERHAALSPDGPDHVDVVLAKLRRMWTMPRPIPADSLAVATAPTLVVSGERDVVRADHTELIAASLPQGRAVIVPDATHDLVAEHPDAIAALVGDFVRGSGR